MLHFRVNVDPARPWKGRPAHSIASATAATAAAAEKSAEGEARFPISKLIPLVQSVTPDQHGEFMEGWKREMAKGGIFLLPMSARSENSRINRPTVETVHPDPTQGHLELRKSAALELLTAMGVPASLVDPAADAGSQREAYRRFVHLTLEPLARIVEAEFSSKLGVECGIDFGSLFAADLAGRGRALKQMVESGVALPEALAIVGLSSDI